MTYSAAPIKRADSESGAGTPAQSLVSTLEMTTAIGEIQAALETLQRWIGVIAAWSDERRDDGTNAHELGRLLLGATQAASERMAEIDSEREQILTSARQMAQTIVSAAEDRARAIEAEATGARVAVPKAVTTAPPRVDATLIMPKVTNGAGTTHTERAPAIESVDDVVPETPTKRVDATLSMPKIEPDSGSARSTPQAKPQAGMHPSRAASLLAALTSFTEANASLAEDVASITRQ